MAISPQVNVNLPPAPGRVEIFVFPLLGVLLVDLLHTRSNELVLLFIPFLICVIRFVPIQSRREQFLNRAGGPSQRRLVAAAANWDTASVLPLALLESVAVIVAGPEMPAGGWVVVAVPYTVYVIMRLAGRRCWQRALMDAVDQ
jgi:hypothetical protein